MAALEEHKQAEIDWRTPQLMAQQEATKPFGWESHHWVRWATIAEMFKRLPIAEQSSVLDVGCGPGWTSLFLAEAAYRVTALDLVPANIEVTADRAARWRVPVKVHLGDMERFDLGEQFDVALIYDALHHSTRPRQVLEQVGAHIKPRGWLLLGETSWLHRFSPDGDLAGREATALAVVVSPTRPALRCKPPSLKKSWIDPPGCACA